MILGLCIPDWQGRGYFDPALPVFEEQLGVRLPMLEYRSSFAFVAVKGDTSRAIVVEKPSEEGPTRLHAHF